MVLGGGVQPHGQGDQPEGQHTGPDRSRHGSSPHVVVLPGDQPVRRAPGGAAPAGAGQSLRPGPPPSRRGAGPPVRHGRPAGPGPAPPAHRYGPVAAPPRPRAAARRSSRTLRSARSARSRASSAARPAAPALRLPGAQFPLGLTRGVAGLARDGADAPVRPRARRFRRVPVALRVRRVPGHRRASAGLRVRAARRRRCAFAGLRVRAAPRSRRASARSRVRWASGPCRALLPGLGCGGLLGRASLPLGPACGGLPRPRPASAPLCVRRVPPPRGAASVRSSAGWQAGGRGRPRRPPGTRTWR